MCDLASPQLKFKDGKTPVSGRFDDVYFSKDDGVAESRYVFLQGCDLPEVFKDKDRFNVGETGFGTGLNFLLTWQALKESQSNCRLHYVAVEAFPLSPDDLQHTYSQFPDLGDISAQLIANYPYRQGGFHHLVFEEGQVCLTLLFGEAAEMLPEVDGCMDAWYLDGFAPSKNPQMWRKEVFQQVARLSHPGTRLATFTSAGHVRRGLIDTGFSMSKRLGFGHKRECLVGIYEGETPRAVHPWFTASSYQKKITKVAVIGAGVAGCVAARRLQEDGVEVTVFERAAQAGSEGSGNRIGIVKPHIVLNQKGVGRFNTVAYLHALRFYDQLAQTPWMGARGLFSMSKNEADEARHKTMVARHILPEAEIEYIDAHEATKRVGLEIPRGGLWYANAGCIEPSKLCQAIAAGLNVQYEQEIRQIEREGDGWVLKTQNGDAFDADAIVLAMAGETSQFVEQFDLPLRGRRGQVSYMAAGDKTAGMKHAVSYGGYMLPAKDGTHIVGASFEHWNDFTDHGYKDILESSHAENRQKLSILLGEESLDIMDGRASIRAMSPDHHPIVGPVFSQDWYVEEYHRLKHGPRAKRFAPAQYVDGLYVLCGLGARGVQTAPLLAEILCAYMSGRPFPVETSIREALHPARFLIRDIKKGNL